LLAQSRIYSLLGNGVGGVSPWLRWHAALLDLIVRLDAMAGKPIMVRRKKKIIREKASGRLLGSSLGIF